MFRYLTLIWISLLTVFPTLSHAEETVEIAMGKDFRPFEFVDENNQPAGLIVDIWRLWSEKTGIPVAFKPMVWSESLELMKTGEADIHAGLNRTEERKAFLDYGDPLLSTNSYVFSPSGMQLSGSIEQLTGFEIAVQDGSLEHSLLEKEVPGARLRPFRHYDELYDAVAQNKVRLFADIEQTGLYFLGQRGLTHRFRFDASRPLDSNYLFAAVAKGRSKLLTQINAGMRRITPQERVEITRRWLRPTETKKPDTLVIAIARNHAPYTFINANGQPAGMLVDIWRLWAEKTGHKIEFRQSGWIDTLNNLGSGDVDIHSGLSRSDDRSSWIEFTRPIYETTSSFFYRAGEALPKDMADKRIGIVDGFSHEKIVRAKHPNAEIVGHGQRDDLIHALTNKVIDAFVDDDRSIEDLVRRLGLNEKIVKAEAPLQRSELMIGLRKGEAELKTLIENGLDAISREEFAEIERRWVVRSESRFFSANPLSLTADEKAWIKANPVIRVHNEMDWPPFNFNREGQPQGYSIDYMNMLADKIGFKLEYVSGPSWNEFLGLMKSGDLDVMLNIVKTPDRLKYMDYTRPYVDNPNTILSQKDHPYDNLEQLFGKTISVPKGFFYEEILKRDYPEIKLHLVKDTLESMKAVTFGKADAALGELAVFNYLIHNHFMSDLVVSGEVKLGSPEYALLNIAARQETPLLSSILDKAVRSIKPEEVRPLKRKWLGEERSKGKASPTLVFTDAERAWLVKHKEIRVGIDRDYPPFEFLDENGKYIGISADYLDLVTKRLGITYTPVTDRSWTDVMLGIKKKEIDLLPAAAKTPEREAYMNFTREHLSHPSVIITRDDYPFITGLNDLKGETVAMIEGYSITEELRSVYPSLKPLMVKNPLQALKAVATGQATAMVGNLAVDTFLIRQNNITNLKIAATADMSVTGLSMGVRKDWPEFVTILDKVLQSITPEEKTAINERWVSVRYDVATDPEVLKRVAMQITAGAGAVIVLVVGFIFIRGRRKEQELREREAAAQAKSDFVAVVSHEVRTPMNGVLGMARMILETPLSPKQKEFARTIVDSGEALLNILNDLLDISKLEAGKLELENIPFSPEHVVKNAVNIMAPRAKEKHLNLHYEIKGNCPTALLGDANRLRQILLNLISNAVKFTEHGEIAVTVLAEKVDGACQLKISVRDTGVGISEQTANSLFAPYVQAAAGVARKYGGTGLGLSICRRLAELMGGTISLDTQLGRGSTFTFQAPFDVTELEIDHSDEDAQVPLAAQAGLRILIVEDNAINAKVANTMVENLGHQATLAVNGRDALDVLNAGKPFDVILMDRHMPVMDGMEATRQIRAMDGPIADIPILAVTAAVTQREVEACLEVGMNAVVSKPIDPDELSAVLADVLEGVGTGAHASMSKVASDESGLPPILDEAVFEKMRGDFGDEVLAELVDDFKNLGVESIGQFSEAVSRQDGEAMTRYAHDLKTNAATLGLARLSEHARTVELACKDGDFEKAHILGRDFHKHFSEARTVLDAVFADDVSGHGEGEALTLFLAKMAHDIRNKMNVILGYTRMLQEYSHDTDTPDSVEDYAQEIRREGAAMLDMANDVLTLSRLENGRLAITPQSVSLNVAIKSVLSEMSETLLKRNIRVHIDDIGADIQVKADPTSLHTVMQYLLANALDQSPDDTQVDVNVSVEGERVQISLVDQGAGVTEKELQAVRSPYSRIWETDGQDGIRALHYNIVDRLMVLNGGELTFSSKPGAGTQATVSLPAAL